jgi:hypothetical protein
LVLSIFFVRETHAHARLEAQQVSRRMKDQKGREAEMSFAQVLLLTSWKDRALFAASQAGMINNLNDGLVWG